MNSFWVKKNSWMNLIHAFYGPCILNCLRSGCINELQLAFQLTFGPLDVVFSHFFRSRGAVSSGTLTLINRPATRAFQRPLLNHCHPWSKSGWIFFSSTIKTLPAWWLIVWTPFLLAGFPLRISLSGFTKFGRINLETPQRPEKTKSSWKAKPEEYTLWFQSRLESPLNGKGTKSFFQCWCWSLNF